MITITPLRYVTPDTDTPFIIFFSFFEFEKNLKDTPTHDSFTHVFKQPNQILRFK